jgi:hypothetical protein
MGPTTRPEVGPRGAPPFPSCSVLDDVFFSSDSFPQKDDMPKKIRSIGRLKCS